MPAPLRRPESRQPHSSSSTRASCASPSIRLCGFDFALDLIEIQRLIERDEALQDHAPLCVPGGEGNFRGVATGDLATGRVRLKGELPLGEAVHEEVSILREQKEHDFLTLLEARVAGE